jgi:hypothetical protein
MPLWADATLYDLCARNLLQGGVLYRDILDTNLPGMVWLHAAIRTLFGWRSEVLRLADCAIVAAIVWILASWLRRASGSGAAGVWTALALVAFYWSTTEGNHCQRDVWMLLPALGALELRRRRVEATCGSRASRRALFLTACVEGLCWGLATWIKPFVLVPAAACGLVASVRVGRAVPRAKGILCLDLGGVLAGGLLAGGLGLAWLLASGAWHDFLDVMVHWNPEYAARHVRWPVRLGLVLGRFPPWGFLHVLAVPVALSLLWRPRLALLAAFYLGWLGQGGLLQKDHEYVQVPAVLLGITLLAVQLARQPLGWPGRVALGSLAVWLAVGHPVLRPERLALWPRCWREGSSAELRDRLRLVGDPLSTDWTELERVAAYLRGLELGDGELTCYNNFTHPLLLQLGLKPSTRILHFDTMLSAFPRRREAIREELARSRQRYVVSDLLAAGLGRGQTTSPGQDLPADFPPGLAELYPWCEPVEFRAGRYVIHRVTGPVGSLVRARYGKPRTGGRTSAVRKRV